MSNIIQDSLFNSGASLIIHPVDCVGETIPALTEYINEQYPHIEREYLKYLRYCKKKKMNTLGTAQYVPADSWALIMADTMKNERVESYDSSYQYIVNLFGIKDFGDIESRVNLKALKNAFVDINNKAKSLGASIAVPYMMFCKDDAEWNKVNDMIQKILGANGVRVEIYDYNYSEG